MTDAELEKFAETMNSLGATFGVEPTRPWLHGYWLALKDLNLDDFQQGAARALATCKRMPVPADLREMSGAQTVAAGALVAWEEVRKAIRRHGAYESVDFGPLVNAVVRNMGGWVSLCGLETAELDKWTRKEFERIYATVAAQGPVHEERGKYLTGIHEATNGANGFAVAPRKLCPVPGHETPMALPPMPDKAVRPRRLRA